MSIIERQRQRRQEARAARNRWLDAVEAGLDHHDISVRWESYLALAHLAAAYMDLEHEASRTPDGRLP